jgi:hypothetical protein
LFNAVLTYIGWKVREWIPGLLGLLLFITVVVCAAASTSFRIILLGTAVVNPHELPAEIRRTAGWMRLVDLTFTGLLVVLAANIVISHTGVAALLVGMAVAGLVAFLVIDPTLARAAFPQAYEPKSRPSETAQAVSQEDRKFRLVAGIQILYLFPLLFAVVQIGRIGEEVVSFLKDTPPSNQFVVALGTGIILAGYVISAMTAVARYAGATGKLCERSTGGSCSIC